MLVTKLNLLVSRKPFVAVDSRVVKYHAVFHTLLILRSVLLKVREKRIIHNHGLSVILAGEMNPIMDAACPVLKNAIRGIK